MQENTLDHSVPQLGRVGAGRCSIWRFMHVFYRLCFVYGWRWRLLLGGNDLLPRRALEYPLKKPGSRHSQSVDGSRVAAMEEDTLPCTPMVESVEPGDEPMDIEML